MSAAEASRGRRQLIGIALAIWVPPLVRLAAQVLSGTRPPTWSVLVSAGVPALLVWGLLRGRDWARQYTVVALALGTVTAVAALVLRASTPAQYVTLIGTAVTWASAATVLARSKAIDAYSEYCAELPDAEKRIAVPKSRSGIE